MATEHETVDLSREAREGARLLRSWWRVDRVRVSPREGRLLRLEPPCMVVVRGVRARVLSRDVTRDESGVTVRYDCVTETGGEGRLEVRCGLSRAERAIASRLVWWTAGRERVALDKEEVIGGLHPNGGTRHAAGTSKARRHGAGGAWTEGARPHNRYTAT